MTEKQAFHEQCIPGCIRQGNLIEAKHEGIMAGRGLTEEEYCQLFSVSMKAQRYSDALVAAQRCNMPPADIERLVDVFIEKRWFDDALAAAKLCPSPPVGLEKIISICIQNCSMLMSQARLAANLAKRNFNDDELQRIVEAMQTES